MVQNLYSKQKKGNIMPGLEILAIKVIGCRRVNKLRTIPIIKAYTGTIQSNLFDQQCDQFVVQCVNKESKKGEVMSGWEIAAVVLVVYWLMNK